MNIYYVYQYLREDLTPYYIGKGKGRRAWSKHIFSIPNNKSRIRIIAHKLNESEAHLLETKLIKFYGRKDLSTGILHNRTDGGEGVSGGGMAGKIPWNKGKPMSAEQKLKLSNSAKKRKPLSEEGRAKISLASSKFRHTEETKKRLSEKHTGKKMSTEAVTKSANARRGKKKPISAETRAKISAALTGKTRPPEVVQKIANSLRLRNSKS